MDNKTQTMLTTAFKNKTLYGLHVDLQEDLGSGLENTFKQANIISTAFKKNRLKNIWIAFVGGPIQHRMTALEFDRKYKATGLGFYIVKPKASEPVFLKTHLDGTMNPEIMPYLESLERKNYPPTFIITGIDSEACYKLTTVGILGKNENIQIVIAQDATNLRIPPEKYLASFSEFNEQYPSRLGIASVAEIKDHLQIT